MIFDLYAVVRNFAVKVAHSLIGSFFRCLFFCIVCVCNNCHWKNQNRRSKMGLTSHISDAYDAFSSSLFSFSLLLSPMKMFLTNQTMKILGPGSLPVCTFPHVLYFLLIVLVDCHLIKSPTDMVT